MQQEQSQITPVVYWGFVIGAAIAVVAFAYAGISIILSPVNPSQAMWAWFMLAACAFHCLAAAWLIVHRRRFRQR
jgi:hypothetical protein